MALLPVLLVAIGSTGAVPRKTYRAFRDRYEGMTLRLRVDLRPATHAGPANTASTEGIGYGRERSPVLFSRLERVYLDRVTSEGARRLGLTVYRSQEEAYRLRASAIPQPSIVNPHASSTLAAFAQLGSTTIVLELKAGKKEPDRQREEIGSLLGRVFYLDAEPSREELEQFILEHRTDPIGRLREVTGLEGGEIRAILDRALPD